MKNKLVVNPQHVVIANVPWTMEEIKELKDLYSESKGLTLDKKAIRTSQILQKALKCDVVISPRVQKGETALLLISQVGLDLIGLL